MPSMPPSPPVSRSPSSTRKPEISAVADSCFCATPGETHFIDFREKAPAAATETCISTPTATSPESNKDSSVVGYRSIGVPGTVAGLVYAEKQYGKLSIEKVMAPAIKFARDGFPLAYEDTQDLKDDEYLAEFPESKRIFLRDGNYYQPGELFKQPELARTLERIAKDPDDFYHGAMARELAAAIHKGGGLVTAEDLAAYEVKEREPIRGSYRGYDIISAPPPSSGGTALIEILNILEGFDLAKFRQPLRRRHPPRSRSLPPRLLRSRRFHGRSRLCQIPSRSSSTRNTPPHGATPST
jgi:gamma-glutamyltranspeptidase / glutathione hydrolase